MKNQQLVRTVASLHPDSIFYLTHISDRNNMAKIHGAFVQYLISKNKTGEWQTHWKEFWTMNKKALAA